MKPKKLFISYRSSDAAKVDKIARDLGLLLYDDGTPRYTTWQDKHNLPPASPNWWDAIVDAIIDCDLFVFNLSRASLQSEVCRAELDYAHKRNRPIIPIVLDGEFFLNPQSGKYDLPKETWALVPDWLGQAQFLFCVETQFYAKFQDAVTLFERNLPRDIPAPRPMNPDSKSVHGSNHALYDAACDYAERLAFADAEKHFDVLVRRNDPDYADVAAQWLELIRLYAELIEIDERRSAAFLFKKKWASYTALYPKEFLDGIFDPKGFADRNEAPPAAPAAAAVPSGRSFIQGVRASLSVLSLLPTPFEWIDIPGTKGETWQGEPYRIAKYPVTNAQFAKFIEAGGYRKQRWWTEAGWEQREKEKWTEPRYWKDKKWNGAEQPVVGVSWYEAVAFCLWLSEVTGEKIMLPTKDQWQYAAQGDDGHTYPWGNEWDCKKCNNSVKPCKSSLTTSVRKYEGKGNSFFGVVDMAGNVWEWCLNVEGTGGTGLEGTNLRGVRGGSWVDSNSDYFRSDYRVGSYPHGWDNRWGFRLALSIF